MTSDSNTILLVSPTEHFLHDYWRKNGTRFKVSSLCETYGIDILALSTFGTIGFQRKTLSDLQSSLLDGRLYRELGQITSSSLRASFLVIESPLRRTSDNALIDSTLTITQLRSIIAKFYLGGVGTIHTDSVADTSQAVSGIVSYLSRGDAERIRRPKTVGDGWGRVNSRQYALFLLQSFPIIGAKTAEAILDHFGKVPLAWTVTEEELLQVPGIGPKTARSLLEVLNA
jgi:DNA excision repair protein ERCC-4